MPHVHSVTLGVYAKQDKQIKISSLNPHSEENITYENVKVT